MRDKLLRQLDCFASTALAILVDEFGPEALNWLPETVVKELETHYPDLPETTINRLLAGQTIVTSDFFYKKLNSFVTLANTLYWGGIDDMVASLPEICWAVTEAQLLFPHPIPEEPGELISSEIYEYILYVLRDAGLLKTPSVLRLIGIEFNLQDAAAGDFIEEPEMFSAVIKIDNNRVRLYDAAVMARLNKLAYQLQEAGFSISPQDMRQLLIKG